MTAHTLHRLRRAGGIPPQFARQIDAATRVAPAEAFRGHTAILLSCARAPGVVLAEDALRELGTFDMIQPVQLPIRSWSEVFEQPAGVSWMENLVMRKIRSYDPSLIAVLDEASSGWPAPRAKIEALISQLHRCGAPAPLAAMRVAPDSGIEWVFPPTLPFEKAG